MTLRGSNAPRAGTLLLLLAEFIALPMPLIHLALWLVVGAAATLLAALILAIWPGKRTDLAKCQH